MEEIKECLKGIKEELKEWRKEWKNERERIVEEIREMRIEMRGKARKENKREEERLEWKKEEEEEETQEIITKKRSEEESERKMEEDRRGKKEEERRARNIVWRGMEGISREERLGRLERVIRGILGRGGGIRNAEERRGEAGTMVVITEMETIEECREIFREGWEIKRRWGLKIDEDLTMEERRARWRMVEKAKEERRKGKKVVVTNRRIWIDGKEWEWDVEERWCEIKGKEIEQKRGWQERRERRERKSTERG